MDWILRNLPLVIAFIFVVISIIRAVSRSQQAREEHGQSPEVDEARRIREIQEEIRRRIAERRGEDASAAPPPLRPAQPPGRYIAAEREHQAHGGPIRRALEDFERRLQPPMPPALPEVSRRELARQERIAEQLRDAEEARSHTQRRAAQFARASEKAEQAEATLRGSTRGHLLADLHDPQSLRRAFVLREVLGPPTGLK